MSERRRKGGKNTLAIGFKALKRRGSAESDANGLADRMCRRMRAIGVNAEDALAKNGGDIKLYLILSVTANSG